MCVWLILPPAGQSAAVKLVWRWGRRATPRSSSQHSLRIWSSHPSTLCFISFTATVFTFKVSSLHSPCTPLSSCSSGTLPLLPTLSPPPFVLPSFPSCYLLVPLNTNATWEGGLLKGGYLLFSPVPPLCVWVTPSVIPSMLIAWLRELLSNRIQCVSALLPPASDPGDYLQSKRRWAWQVGMSSWSVANGLFSIFSGRLLDSAPAFIHSAGKALWMQPNGRLGVYV